MRFVLLTAACFVFCASSLVLAQPMTLDVDENVDGEDSQLVAALEKQRTKREDEMGQQQSERHGLGTRIAKKAKHQTNRNKDDNNDSKVSIFGWEFELPEWMQAVRDGLRAAYDTAKGFLMGKSNISAHVLGRNVSIHSDGPDSLGDVWRSAGGLVKKLKRNESARVMLALYFNVMVFIFVYFIIFIKQIQLSLKLRRNARAKRRSDAMDGDKNRNSADINNPNLGAESRRNILRKRTVGEQSEVTDALLAQSVANAEALNDEFSTYFTTMANRSVLDLDDIHFASPLISSSTLTAKPSSTSRS